MFLPRLKFHYEHILTPLHFKSQWKLSVVQDIFIRIHVSLLWLLICIKAAVTFSDSKCCILPRWVEPFNSLLLVTPSSRILILARTATACHRALHMPRDDVAKALPHFCVFCRRPPWTSYNRGKNPFNKSLVNSSPPYKYLFNLKW